MAGCPSSTGASFAPGPLQPTVLAAATRVVAGPTRNCALADGGAGGDSHPPFSGGTLVPSRIEDVLNRPIEDLAELSVRSRNSLQKENIQTVRDLVQRTEDQMLNIDNFGKKSLQEISDFLAGQGLRFGVQLEEGENGTLWWSEGGEDNGSGGKPASDQADEL